MTEHIDFPNGPSACSDSPHIHLVIHDSIHLVKREDWDPLAQQGGLYLQFDYLRVLEKEMTGSMEFRYVTYYCDNYEPLGIAYFQVVDLIDNGSKYRDAVAKMGAGLGARIVKEMKLRSLVCGNVFHCGDNGYFCTDKVKESEAILAIESTMERLKHGGRLDTKVSIVLFKEFWPHQFEDAKILTDKKFHKFPMDVNMVMDVRPEWSNMDEYMSALTSKSRTRIKSILKKSASIDIRALDADEIAGYEKEMDVLFESVLKHSPFIFGRLEMAVYSQWKEVLGDKLMFHGLFIDDKLVGFNSAFIMDDDVLDVHYVGIDYELNGEHMTYQRMLIDIVDFAIKNKLKQINFGRTAEQAKSSFGATPVSMMLYTKHRSAIANKLIGPLMSSVKETEFEIRKPFKELN